jgi:hypothetical protein
MNDNQLSRVLERLAEQLTPADIDLWPVIRKHFETSKQPSYKGDLSMTTILARNQRLRLAGALILAVLVMTAMLFATPQGRAWAQEAWHFFTRAGSDRLPVQSWQKTPVATPSELPTPDPGSILDAKMTVKEVAGLAGYPVREPGRLVGSLSFSGASYDSRYQIARIFYQDDQSNSLALREEQFQRIEDCALCSTVGASTAVETVQIGDVTGEYVVGVWKLTDKGPVWESDPYLQRLRWQADGMAYELVYMGQPDSLTKDDLVAIAASIK